MIVIYAEKKSVASSIAKALGAGEFKKKKDLTKKKLGFLGYWVFIWNGEETYIIYGVGHLTTLFQAKDYDSKYERWGLNVFPCIPTSFKTKPVENSVDYYNLAYDLFIKADLIISATDSDREGQVVFEYLYKTIGVQTKWKRAWLPSDLTPAKIKESFNNLEEWSVHYPLTLAGIVRSIADWTVGCNLTVAATLKYGGKTLMNMGRVQTTVLSMVSERTREIESFQSQPFWKISADIRVNDSENFKASMIEPPQFFSKEEAEKVLLDCESCSTARIIAKEIKHRTLKKPLLYSTTELQIAVNKKYGYDVPRIAEDMEALYNNHFISYPRTNAVVLSNALEKETANNIKKLFSTSEYKPFFRSESNWALFTNRHFDDYLIAKTEDSHTAVVPTGVIPDFSELTVEQRNIYDMIAKSIICLVYDDVEIEDTTLTIQVKNYEFKVSGSVVLNYKRSWYSVLKQEPENVLPEVKEGKNYPFELNLIESKTKPNPYYTQASLLKAMTYADKYVDDEDVAEFMKSSDCGLGTGGTRPQIIGGLLSNQLLQLDKKHLIPTEKGFWLIDHIPDELKMLKNPATTGKWEQMLNKIATSDLQTAKRMSAQFINRINSATKMYFQVITDSPTDLFSETNMGRKMDGSIYNCPKCGMPLHRFEWGFGCTGNQSGCTFAIGKFRNKKLTDKQMTDLIEKGKTGKISFTSKDGRKYNGFLSFDEDKNIKFNFVAK